MKLPEKYHFIIYLGKALHLYGIPSYKIQMYLNEVSSKLKIEGSFNDLPTMMTFSFYDKETDDTYFFSEKVPLGELNLGAFTKSTEITDRLLANQINTKQAKSELVELQKSNNKSNEFLIAFGYAGAAFIFNILIGTNWNSAFLSFFLGFIVYIWVYFSQFSKFIKSILESITSLTTAILASIASIYISDINVPIIILSSIIIFIPGLSITIAFEEAAAKNLVSGSAKLFNAIMSLFKQFFGAYLGLSIIKLFISNNEISMILTSNIPEVLHYLAAPLFVLCIIPIFNVRKKNIPLVLICSTIGYITALFFSFTGLLISTFIATITIILLSKIASKINKTPKTVFSTLGILMLVPGSKAFMGLSGYLIKENTIISANTGEQIALILMGLIGGLLFSGSFIKDN